MARTSVTARELRNRNPATRATVLAKLAESDAALDAVCDSTGNEHVTAAGALSVTCFLTTLAISGTMAFTLAAGTKTGQHKAIRCITAASTPAGTVTGAFVNGVTAATSIAMNAAEDTVHLVWNGSAWAISLAISVSIT